MSFAEHSSRPFETLDLHLLPPPASAAFDNLVREQHVNGVHTTADETAEAIEVWYRLLGALVLAEYLDAGAPSGQLNRWLFSLLADKRPVLSGTWIAVGRVCHAVLLPIWDKGRQPTWDGLTRIDLGQPEDRHHPVSRLINYRNHFGHGSFAQVEEEILEHGHLLEQQVRLLYDDLAARPIHLVNQDHGIAVLQGHEPGQYAHTLPDTLAPKGVPPGTAYVEMSHGRHRILAPAVQLTITNHGHWSLGHAQLDNRKRPLDPALLQQFADNLQRYRTEQAGHLKFDEHEAPQIPDATAPAVTGLGDALDSQAVLTLVQYRPGTGQSTLAARLWGALAAQCDQAFLWRVIRDQHGTHPSIQGRVFARALLRHAEKTLGLEEGKLEPANADLLPAVASAGAFLVEHHRQVGCVLMDADVGLPASASDSLSVIDVCKAATGGYRLVLLAPPARNQSLPHDGPILQADLPGADTLDRDELRTAMDRWLNDHREIRLTVLQQLVENGQEWAECEEPLQAVVESVEQVLNKPVFAPAVEHALWTAAPVLELDRRENLATTWSIPASPGSAYQAAITDILRDHVSQGGQDQ